MPRKDINGITQEQEELAKAYIHCLGNKSKAFRMVKDTSKLTTKSLWESASRAFRDVNLMSRIQELQDLATERHLVTIDTLTQELQDSFNLARDTEQPSAMTGSTAVKAKLHGFMIDKSEAKVKHSGLVTYKPMIKRFDGSVDPRTDDDS